jgi:hypothetical protein
LAGVQHLLPRAVGGAGGVGGAAGDRGRALRAVHAASPPPTPGQIEAIDVVRALQAQGMTVQQVQQGVPRGAFSAPGQGLTVDGEPVYLFIFPDPATAQREVAAADPFAVLPASAMPTPGRAEVPSPDAAPPMIVQGSNVAVAMPGGSDDQRAKVRAAIEGLP